MRKVARTPDLEPGYRARRTKSGAGHVRGACASALRGRDASLILLPKQDGMHQVFLLARQCRTYRHRMLDGRPLSAMVSYQSKDADTAELLHEELRAPGIRGRSRPLHIRERFAHRR